MIPDEILADPLHDLRARATRGGRVQRAAALHELEQATGNASHTADPPCGQAKHWIQEWAWGHMSAPEVQHAASLAYTDQIQLLRSLNMPESAASDVLRDLSRIGNNGVYANNTHRDLQAMLGEPSMPKAFHASIPVKILKPRRGQTPYMHMNMSFLLPHEYFHYLYSKRPTVFKDIMLGGSRDNLHKFWSESERRNDPRYAQLHLCEATREHDWQHKSVPLSLHGDKVPVLGIGKAGTRSLDVTSMQSLLAVAGSSLRVKMPICAVFDHNKVDTTDEEMGKVILWSLRALEKGKWPTHDHHDVMYDPTSAEGILAGQDLAAGFKCILYIQKSDLDHLAKPLGLRHYSANMPCDLCPCDKAADASLWPSNFFDGSAWTHASYTADEWRALYDEAPSWPFRLGHMTQLNVEPEELHVIWLGTAQWTAGSVLWMLVFRLMPHAASENMALLWAQICSAYRDLDISVQYNNLNIGSFTDPQKPHAHFPKLKGKGAEVKHLSAVLCRVWEHNMDGTNDEHKLVADMLDDQFAFQQIIDEHSDNMFLPPEQADALQRSINSFLANYTRLGHLADSRGELLFNMTIKFHWLYHLGQRCHYLSPRRGACWLDEDYVNKWKIIAQACSRGMPLHSIPSKAIEKMRWGLDILHRDMADEIAAAV